MPPKDALTENLVSAPTVADDSLGGGLLSAINSMPEGVALFDTDDCLVYFNETFQRRHPLGKKFAKLGISFEYMVRANVEKGNALEAIGREEEFIRERMELHRNPMGPIYRHLNNGASVIINESRTPDGGTLYTTTEVTELKQIEKDLREKEALTRRMLEASPVGVLIANRKGKHLFANERALDIQGVSRDELFSTNATGYYADPGERKRLKDNLYKTGDTPPTEVELVKPDGTHYFVILSSTLIEFEGQKAHLTYLYDITELKRAEEALRSSESRLRGAIDSLQEGFAFYDADDRLVLFNDEYRRLHPGLDDVIKPGMYCEDLLRAKVERGLSAEAQGREQEHIRERMEHHRNPKGTLTRTLADGTSYIITENRTVDGGTVVTETDITERRKLESQALAEHHRLLDAIDSIDGGVALFDADDILLLCNATYRERLQKIEPILSPGISYEEIIRAFAKQGLNTEAKADPEKYVRERLARHRKLEPSTVQMTDTGAWIMLREYRTSEGGTLLIRTDETARIQDEEALHASETLLRTIMDNADVDITLKDLDGKFLLSNRKFQENHGLTHEQIAGKTLSELYSPEEAMESIEMERKVLKTGEPFSQELKPINGPVRRTYFTTKFPIRNDAGDIVSIGTINIEITNFKEAEIALMDSEARFRDIAEAASDHFWEMGPDLCFKFISERFYENTGLAPEDFIGKTRWEFVGAETIEENLELWATHRKEVEDHQPFRNFEYSLRLSNGQTRYLSTSGKPFFGLDGTFMGYRGVSTDITDYRRAQSDLSQHNKMESLGYLAGGMAHNLNNLMQPILILGEMTKNNLQQGSRDHQNLEIICRAGASAQELVERISAFSRQQDLNRKSLDVVEIIQDGLSLIRPTVPASITIREDLDRETGQILVDKAQILTVMMNLISNAIDAMEGITGELIISLSRIKIDEPSSISGLESGVYAKLAITDSGHGIDEGTLNKIFDPFFTTKSIGKGTGLGLSTAFGIVHKHGGIIRAMSKPGDNTTFEIYLPLIRYDTF
ncbi:MAG: PAS-domain containing protein [Proteobacteria bacterium]|nr:PAS-domain containing protein [Pseudomonadota bacterium]